MTQAIKRVRGQDLNLRPSGYEPDELPDCSTPRHTGNTKALAYPVSRTCDNICAVNWLFFLFCGSAT